MDQLRANIRKKQCMARKAAPITIESSGFARISRKMEYICEKLKKNKQHNS